MQGVACLLARSWALWNPVETVCRADYCKAIVGSSVAFVVIITNNNSKVVPGFARVQGFFFEWPGFVFLTVFPKLKDQLGGAFVLH